MCGCFAVLICYSITSKQSYKVTDVYLSLISSGDFQLCTAVRHSPMVTLIFTFILLRINSFIGMYIKPSELCIFYFLVEDRSFLWFSVVLCYIDGVTQMKPWRCLKMPRIYTEVSLIKSKTYPSL